MLLLIVILITEKKEKGKINTMRESVAAILTFKDEVFVIKRQNYLNAFPGYLSFIGGKIDDKDHDGEVDLNQQINIDSYILKALFRELDEEINISADIVKKSIKEISYLGDFITPDFNPLRFQTHYVKIELTEKLDIKAIEDEAKFSSWVKCTEVLDWFFKGNILIVPPVLNTISRLANQTPYFAHDTQDDAVELIHGLVTYMPKTNTLPPAIHTNCFYLNESGILIDPASKDQQEYEKYLALFKKISINAILLTHHHIDHIQNTGILARALTVPIYCSEDTFHRVQRVYDQEFFKNIEVKILKDGDSIGEWKKKSLKIMEVPGHDEGQIAIYPETKEWIIVSDLFQGMGTVVIGTEEGDMVKYFASLQKVIDQDFKAIIPSHGIPLGGITHLEKVLAHRKMREGQIKEHMLKGLNEDEILHAVYEGTPENLLKYATLNIRSHIKKINLESTNKDQE